jgi:hypothetical protein
MKFIHSILCLSILFIGCQPKPDNSVNETFEKNSKTVLSYLEGFQNESLDYSVFYSKDFVWLGTDFESKDSLNLEELMANDKAIWKMYDFELLTSPVNLLPGVDVDTKLPDGSVRFYGEWKVTLPKTDSTEEKSGVMKLYESFGFDEEGKILYQGYYGDVSALFMFLNSKE